MSVVSNLSFEAQVGEWVKKTEDRLLAVFRESSQRVISLAANGVPIDTGFARASIQASLTEMPAIDPSARPMRQRREGEERGSLYTFEFGQVSLTINGAQIGDTIYAGWTAAYVIYLEFGSSMQAPLGFVRIAAAQWPQIVDEVAREAQSRATPSM